MQFSVHLLISVLVFAVRHGAAEAKSTTPSANGNVKEDWPDLAAQGIKLFVKGVDLFKTETGNELLRLTTSRKLTTSAKLMLTLLAITFLILILTACDIASDNNAGFVSVILLRMV